MDILPLQPLICKYCKKEFKGQRSNSLLKYHLGTTKPPFIANGWHRQQSPKNSAPTSGCDKYNGSKRCDQVIILSRVYNCTETKISDITFLKKKLFLMTF